LGITESKEELIKKERQRHIMRLLLGAVLILIEAIIFFIVWKEFFNPYIRRPYRFKGNYFLAGIYTVLLLIFGNIYGGMKIGYYKVFDIILSQSVSIIITNAVTYIAVIIPIATWYLSPLPIMGMTVINIIIIIVWSIAANRIFVSAFPPQRLFLFYGSEEDKLAAKFITRPDRYKLCGSEKVEGRDFAESLAKKCEAYDGVIIGDISAELRNDLLKQCFVRKIRTYTLPKITDVILKSSETLHIFDSPVFLNRNHGLTAEQASVKRCMDIVLSGLALIILSPVFLITALAIKLEDGGPVFFRQDRCTIYGRVFSILKFRSMIVGAEKEGVSIPATEKDPRITKIGAFIRATRIDELPQLINILKGDMSIVGPRPERVEHVEKYSAEIPEFSYRLMVKGGLTGYAQVYGKYNTTAYDKLKLDLMYIQNYSLLLDIELIFKTIKILFTRESTEGFSEERSEEMGRKD
jgi:exopolysaccharide biosynthesis polyprenyl glycosylphosphotransferase